MFHPDGIAPMGPAPRGNGHGDGWLGAALLFAVAVIAALVLLGQTWGGGPTDLIMQDSKRPMLMLPMPR